MKKVLALVLAVMMLATVAMAADLELNEGNATGNSTYDSGDWVPGSTIKINAEGVMSRNPNYDRNPVGDQKLIKDINTTNYSISSIKYNEGKSLISSIRLNDKEDRVDIKLTADYTNTKGKNIDLTFTLKGKKSGNSKKPADIDIAVKGTINYALVTLDIIDTDEVETPAAFDENTVYEFEENGSSYGTLEFTADGDEDVDVEVRVYDGDKFYLYSDADSDDDILKAYADTDADITFLNFDGEPTFNSTATVYFYKEEDSYIYGVKDGKLVNVNAKWSDDDGAFILKARTLGSYVFSDKKLSVSAGSDSAASNNPDTGANDVVGIATALAAVALVSAAAVSLKK